MLIRKHNPLDPIGGTETTQSVVLARRKWLKLAGLSAGASLLGTGGHLGWRAWQGSDEQVTGPSVASTEYERRLDPYFPARRDQRFHYDRAETDRSAAARYTNFYEFSRFKWCWKYVDDFRPYPWQIAVRGLCRQPLTLDLDRFHRRYAPDLVERQYRHRCVERWAMAIPWTGVPLARLLADVDPLPQATHVMFVSFLRPEEAPHQRAMAHCPWPYTEGLTLPEAANDLTLLATGMYGQPLLKQHGAPLRLVVPWKYGFKSIKSIERIELIDFQPPTFWSTLNAEAYPFEANVEPAVPRPWPQHEERMLGTNDVLPTQLYNGYGEFVANLY